MPLRGCQAGWLAGRLAGRLAGWLFGWLAGRNPGWRACRLAGWWAGKQAGWQAGWLVGKSAGWVSGWLDDSRPPSIDTGAVAPDALQVFQSSQEGAGFTLEGELDRVMSLLRHPSSVHQPSGGGEDDHDVGGKVMMLDLAMQRGIVESMLGQVRMLGNCMRDEALLVLGLLVAVTYMWCL